MNEYNLWLQQYNLWLQQNEEPIALHLEALQEKSGIIIVRELESGKFSFTVPEKGRQAVAKDLLDWVFPTSKRRGDIVPTEIEYINGEYHKESSLLYSTIIRFHTLDNLRFIFSIDWNEHILTVLK